MSYSSTSTSELVQRTVDFVKQQLKSNDASHDWLHIERVWTLARTIADEEGIPDDSREIVDLAALLHDIDDWKYQCERGNEKRAERFLQSQQVDPERIALIIGIIDGIGFKDELAHGAREITPEFACVQDADRLDAIGAIGIARCLTYGGAKKRALYDPDIPPNLSLSKEEYMHPNRPSTTINHFYEKLLKLRHQMKTNAGKRIANERHAFMELFLQQFFRELEGRG